VSRLPLQVVFRNCAVKLEALETVTENRRRLTLFKENRQFLLSCAQAEYRVHCELVVREVCALVMSLLIRYRSSVRWLLADSEGVFFSSESEQLYV
jgi:hypothetical protein